MPDRPPDSPPDVLVLADPLSAEVFYLTDFTVRAVPPGADAARALAEALGEGFRIVFVTENLAEGCAGALRALQPRGAQERPGPIVTVIPGAGSSLRLGRRLLADLERSVVGI